MYQQFKDVWLLVLSNSHFYYSSLILIWCVIGLVPFQHRFYRSTDFNLNGRNKICILCLLSLAESANGWTVGQSLSYS